MATDLASFVGTVGGGFCIGFITGYAIKKVIKLAALIVGLFIAALAYLEYEQILNMDWHKVQAILRVTLGAVTSLIPIHHVNAAPFKNGPPLMAFFMPAARLKGPMVPITLHSVAWGSQGAQTLIFLKIVV